MVHYNTTVWAKSQPPIFSPKKLCMFHPFFVVFIHQNHLDKIKVSENMRENCEHLKDTIEITLW